MEKTTGKVAVSRREIWRIALPIMLGNLAQTIITFTDTAFLGHVGSVELSASMMAGLYYFVYTTLAMGFAVGIQIFVARRYGEARFESIGVVFFHGAVFVGGLGLLLFGLLFFCSDWLMPFFIASEDIRSFAFEYLSYRQFGIFFVVFNYLFRSFYVGISRTRAIASSTLLMAAVNVFLDYALIFGKFGLPRMGVGGAAVASLAAECCAFCFFFIHTFVTVPKSYGLFRRHALQPELFRSILKLAFPSMLQRLFSFGTWFVFFVLIEKMGETAIGVSSVIRSVYMVLIIPGFAFASTANTLTSRIIGEGRAHQVEPLLWKIGTQSILSALPMVLLMLALPLRVVRIFTADPLLAEAAIPVIHVVAVATIVSALTMVFFEAVSGTGNTLAALSLEFGVLVTYILYVYVVSQHLPIQWVWMAEWVYNILIGAISYRYLRKAAWRKKKL
ncbi:MAG: MATE family efflux transporter [Bacteroidales bacterium]|nr:MATE family efflux transporter [Bacteroidales bacterium]